MTRESQLTRRLAMYARNLISPLSPRQIRELFPAKSVDGSTPIVIAEASERVSAVTARIQSAGETANVLVVGGQRTHRLVVSSISPAHGADSDAIEIPNNITMGMFVSYLQVEGNVAIHIHSGDVSVEGMHVAELELAV